MAIAVAATEEPATRCAKDPLEAIIERIERLERKKTFQTTSPTSSPRYGQRI